MAVHYARRSVQAVRREAVPPSGRLLVLAFDPSCRPASALIGPRPPWHLGIQTPASVPKLLLIQIHEMSHGRSTPSYPHSLWVCRLIVLIACAVSSRPNPQVQGLIGSKSLNPRRVKFFGHWHGKTGGNRGRQVSGMEKRGKAGGNGGNCAFDFLFACCCLLLDPHVALCTQRLIFCSIRIFGMSKFLLSLPPKATTSLGPQIKLLPSTRRPRV